MTGETDDKLVAKSLQGNEKAFRRLVERHQAMVFAVVRGVLGDRSDVEDVVQDVFIKVFKALPRFRGDAALSSWIYRIARNEAINAAKRLRVVATPVEDVVLAAPGESDPEATFEARERRGHLERYLAMLDENYRVALELRYMGEKSYAEISDIMELPVGTVKSYIHRAKAELKRVMTHRTVDGEHKKLRAP